MPPQPVHVAPAPAIKAVEPLGKPVRDGLGNEVYTVLCCYCKTEVRAPFVGTGIVKCGVCKEFLQIKRPDASMCEKGHSRAQHRTGLGGFVDPTTCLCETIFYWAPDASALYAAIALTCFIVGMGFLEVAPRLFPSATTGEGAVLWTLSVYISFNTLANFYLGASTDAGRPPLEESTMENAAKCLGGSSVSRSSSVSHPRADREVAVCADNVKEGGDKQQSACSEKVVEGGDQQPSASTSATKWCDACAAPKPPGTHHCRRCKRCVYRMDHHCAFLNNCVGAGNHRFFLLFLFWVSLACFYVAVCCYVDICDMLVSARVGRVEVIDSLTRDGKLPETFKKELLRGQGITALVLTVLWPLVDLYIQTVGWEVVFLFVTASTTFILVFMLLCYHLRLAYKGVTQLEHQFKLPELDTSGPRGRGGGASRSEGANGRADLDTPVPRAKGLAGIRAVLTPQGADEHKWLWLIACLWPIPPPPVSAKRHSD